MLALILFCLAGLLAASPARAQQAGSNAASFRVYTQHPRLWLDDGRVERLRREVSRQSDRWQRLHELDEQGAAFPEEPLWRALQFQAARADEAGRRAVDWALAKAGSESGFSDPADLRLGAVVFDWCYSLFSDDQRSQLSSSLGQSAHALASLPRLQAGPFSSAFLAAVAVADDWDASARTLSELVERHWNAQLLPALLQGTTPDRSADWMAILEMFHAARFNLDTDYWREAQDVFRPLPRVRMLRYYPVPAQTQLGPIRELAQPSWVEVDPKNEGPAARIAEMMLVGYESTLTEYQFLQGWIRHDAFVMQDPYGAVYELIWVNPYLPGLSYSNSPAVAHDKIRGRLFARQGWDDDDVWIGYIEGELQIFADGQRAVIPPDANQAPLTVPGAAVVPVSAPMKFEVEVPPATASYESPVIYLVGLREGEACRVKVNKGRFQPYRASRGGIVAILSDPTVKQEIDFSKPVRVEIRLGR